MNQIYKDSLALQTATFLLRSPTAKHFKHPVSQLPSKRLHILHIDSVHQPFYILIMYNHVFLHSTQIISSLSNVHAIAKNVTEILH